MRITFSGLDRPIDVLERGITMLQIENESLFARVCDSLISLKGDKAIEPYSVWNEDGDEISPSGAFIVVANPFDLPWKHKGLMGGLYSKLEKELLIDEDLRQELYELGAALEGSAHKLGFQMNANYRFGVEWNLGSYLKAFSFEVEVLETAPKPTTPCIATVLCLTTSQIATAPKPLEQILPCEEDGQSDLPLKTYSTKSRSTRDVLTHSSSHDEEYLSTKSARIP